MKTVIALAMVFLLTNCMSTNQQKSVEQIDQEIAAGKFSRASVLIDSLMSGDELTPDEAYSLRFTRDSLHRVSLDFNRTKEEVIAWIEMNQQFTPSDSMIEGWEQSGSLEYRLIDGEKRYFRNAAPNLFRVDATAREHTQAARH